MERGRGERCDELAAPCESKMPTVLAGGLENSRASSHLDGAGKAGDRRADDDMTMCSSGVRICPGRRGREGALAAWLPGWSECESVQLRR